jgi:hypothetical protein
MARNTDGLPMVMRARMTSPVDQRVTPVPFAAATWDRGFLFRTAADIFGGVAPTAGSRYAVDR